MPRCPLYRPLIFSFYGNVDYCRYDSEPCGSFGDVRGRCRLGYTREEQKEIRESLQEVYEVLEMLPILETDIE